MTHSWLRLPIATLGLLSSALVGTGPAGAASAGAYVDFPQVVGGDPVSPGQFPFLVRVVSTTDSVCTGSLIADDWVMTAGHCGEPERVYITDALPPAAGPGHVVHWIEPKSWIRHPGFDPDANPVDFTDDIALIELAARASDFPPELNGVPLYAPEPILVGFSPPTTTSSLGDVIIAGFGLTTSGGSLPTVANWAGGIPTLPAASCLFPTTPALDLCYGTFPNNCPGDSGGAIFRQENGAFVQYGIVSIVTLTCGAGNSRGTYVPGYASWIQQQMDPPAGGPITVEWELPRAAGNGEVATGASNAQGWAFSSDGAIETIELWVDGKLEQTFPCCSDRGDVKAVHPQAPVASGFAGVVSWARFGSGLHSMELKVKDAKGNQKSLSRTVEVVRILPGVNFVLNLSADGASCQFTGPGTFSCSGLAFDQGTCAGAIEFRWANAKQAWEVSQGCP